MERLEERLDREVGDYLSRVERIDEVSALLSGDVSQRDYIRFLKTFYIIEYISQRAVLKAAERTQKSNPYLSERFRVCARGELGHAELALEDLSEMGIEGVEITEIPLAVGYDGFLMDEARKFPLGILGHSYLFENASGIMFPKHRKPAYPSKFIEVHAKEDPGHSLAIKRTVRRIETDLSADEEERIIGFAKKSGDYLLRLFRGLEA